MLNLRQRGYARDKSVVLDIEAYKVLDINQIRLLHFNFTYGKRKAEERLLKLYRAGKLERWWGEEGYCYSLEAKPGRAQHLLETNWVRLWFERTKKSWERIHTFQYEYDYQFLRADGFVAKKNTTTGKFGFWFVELDRSLNAFDKVKKYNKLFEAINSGKFERWWVKITDKFPTVLVVTHTAQRKEKILQHIAEENKNGLNFEVRLLSEIREELK